MDDIWGHFQQTGFNKHFSSQNTTITTLLLDENIITELKNQNPQLLQYLDQHKHQFITEMIENTIVMPKESEGYDRCHRLPYISSQLLALDSDLIYKEFFKEGQDVVDNMYWKQLLAFLDGDSALNEVLMGYFQKVISNLYMGSKTKTSAVVSNSLDKFIKLLPNGSIGDVIKKSLVLHNQAEGVVLEQRKRILRKMMIVFIEASQDVKAICADILGEVVNKFQAFSSGDALIEELLASQNFLQLYSIESSEAVNGFLIFLIKKSQQKIINQFDESVPILSLPEPHKQKLQKYLKRQTQNIRNISKSTGFIINQNKQTVRKSSRAIYPILNLVGLVLKDNYSNFVDEGLMNFLWNLVLLYPYNDILHGLVRSIFIGVLNCNDVAVKKCFLMNYEASVVNLGKQHLVLLRSFLYSVWMEARKYPQVTSDPLILSQFQEFVEKNLQPLVKYQIKNVQKQQNTHQKLIVDEGDLAKAAPQEEGSEKMMTQGDSSQKVEEKKVEEEKQDEKEQIEVEKEEVENQNRELQPEKEQKVDKLEEEKKNPQAVKDTFDFFATTTISSTNKPEQTVKSEQKEEAFDNFFETGLSPPKAEEQTKNQPDQNGFDLFTNFQASPPKRDTQKNTLFDSLQEEQPKPQEQVPKKDAFDDFINF